METVPQRRAQVVLAGNVADTRLQDHHADTPSFDANRVACPTTATAACGRRVNSERFRAVTVQFSSAVDSAHADSSRFTATDEHDGLATFFVTSLDGVPLNRWRPDGGH